MMIMTNIMNVPLMNHYFCRVVDQYWGREARAASAYPSTPIGTLKKLELGPKTHR